MVDGLDVVAVGVEHEGRVVGAVVGALARAAAVLAAGGERRGVEAIDRRAILRLEGEMHAVGRRAAPPHLAGAAHVELVAGEGLRGLVAQLAPEGAERSAVEAAAGLEIAHHEVDVVEETPEVVLSGHCCAPSPVRHVAIQRGAG